MDTTAKFWKRCSSILAMIMFAGCLTFLCLAGCSSRPQSDQQLQDQARRDTETAKHQARQAAAEAKVAAANAERKANDIAAGVKEGLHNDNSSNGNSNGHGSIDINTASEARLTTLPGITPARARRIIGNRPYSDPHDLVSKGVVSSSEYDQISGDIVAGDH